MRQMRREVGRLEPVGFRRGMVGELRRQRGQVHRSRRSVRGIRRAELALQHRHRPAIADEVVERDHDDVIGLAESNHQRTEQAERA